MPKPVLFLVGLIALAVAIPACGGNNSTPTVTPAPSVSFTPNPKDHTAIILVTVLGSPTAKLPVDLSTPAPHNNGRPGSTIQTLTTNHKGKVKFTGLKPSKTYCFWATLPKGSKPPKSGTCASWDIWQNGQIEIGS